MGSIIERLDKQALARMEASTARYMTEWVPAVERYGNRSPVMDGRLFGDLAAHEFSGLLGAGLDVSRSMEEFETFARGDAPQLLCARLAAMPFIGPQMMEELEQGLIFFLSGMNPWTDIPESERDQHYHVGAPVGEALSHTALEWRARALERVAEGTLPEADEPKPEAAAPMPEDELVIYRLNLLKAYRDATGASEYAIYNAAQHSCHKPEFLAWKGGKLPAKSQTAQSLERFLESKAEPEPRPKKSTDLPR
jgi:hypothetical protein